jgi:hypothetical protein
MRVFVQSCGAGLTAWTHQYGLLRELHAASVPRRHEWVENPDEADLILLSDVLQPDGDALATQDLPRRHPEKCFALSEQWQPPFLLAGIYANAPRRFGWQGRFRTGSYALHHPDFRNPYIAADSGPADRAHPNLIASFLGRNCHPVRARLLALDLPAGRYHIEDARDFNAFQHDGDKRAGQRRYYDLCLRSKFMLCPRGAGPNSIRLFEALQLGIAPVIIADAWIPCEGPRWGEFALFVPEADLAQLPALLEREESTYRRRGALARAAHEQFFAPPAYFNYLVAATASARAARVIPESWFLALRPLQRWGRRGRRLGRRIFLAPSRS